MTDSAEHQDQAREPLHSQEQESDRDITADDDDYDDEVLPEEEIHNDCRCAECCRNLIIERDLEDAEREPQIRVKGAPIYTPAELTGTGQKELEGYLLNSKDNGYACTFLDQTSNLCSIYPTRPWACRVFDCEGEGREQLIQLDVLPLTSSDSTPSTHAARLRKAPGTVDHSQDTKQPPSR
jgi:Fe-S-cluster containining protein